MAHYHTVNLKPETYQKLRRFKFMGKSYDQVINEALDELDPRQMYEQALEEHRQGLKEIEAGEYFTLDELKKKYNVT